MTHRTFPLLAAAAILTISACGSDQPDAGSPAPPPVSAAPTAPTPAPSTTPTAPQPEPSTTSTTSTVPTTPVSADPGVVTIELRDFTFDGLPESVPVGTKLTVHNTSSTELHEVVAFRIPDNDQRTASDLIALPEAEFLTAVGPIPAMVLLAAPGEPQIAALGDGTLTDPGRYILLCSIPTGVDPDVYLAAAAESVGPPDVPGGPPHFTHGMYAELTVE